MFGSRKGADREKETRKWIRRDDFRVRSADSYRGRHNVEYKIEAALVNRLSIVKWEL